MEDADEEEERKGELEANNKIMNDRDWVKLQMQIPRPTAERRDLLRAMALQFSQGSGVDANNLLLDCICRSEPAIRPGINGLRR